MANNAPLPRNGRRRDDALYGEKHGAGRKERDGMNWESVCYGCFREKPEDAAVCPHCGFPGEEEQPFLALPLGGRQTGLAH